MQEADQIIKRIVLRGLRIFNIDADDKKITSLTQFIKFAIVGVSNTLISYGLNILVLKILEQYHISYDYIIANVVAFILSVLWSFYWNNRYVFVEKGEKKTRSVWGTLLRTYIAYGFTGLLLTNVLSYVWIDVLNVSKLVAPIINLIISVPLNFLINKYWAFKA